MDGFIDMDVELFRVVPAKSPWLARPDGSLEGRRLASIKASCYVIFPVK
jgi:hypothetical protein